MITSQQKIQHLLWRAGFGPSVHYTPATDVNEELANIFNNAKNTVPLVLPGWGNESLKELKALSENDKAAFRLKERNARIGITTNILDGYKNSTAFLRHKMTLFWMGHFACRVPNPAFAVPYYNMLLKNSLGSFETLLTGVTRNPAMLQYLSNNQNRKTSPNENFARELMELFTLGRGNYTETDVREVAKAFTGWAFDKDGEFIIRKEQHDTGEKNFLGKSGNFDADDVVQIILSKKECADFITTKIYKFFVNEVPDVAEIKKLSSAFYSSGYQIDKLLHSIFTSENFYNTKNIGVRIKSPVELITGISRQFDVSFENPQAQVQVQKILGQTLFDPPNVAGWPTDKNWIDSSTMIYRMRLPQVLLENAASIIQPREEFDIREMAGPEQKKEPIKLVKTNYDSSLFVKKFKSVKPENTTAGISNYLLQSEPDKNKKDIIDELCNAVKGDARIIKTAIYVMSLPEYQLC